MPVKILCSNPACDASYSIADETYGRLARCRKCGAEFPLVPGDRPEEFPSWSADARTADAAAPETVEPALAETFGRYKIRRMLGRGGMGTVYLAHDLQLDRDVALKIPHIIAFADRPDVRERFFREARAAARFHHPGFCPIHDIGEVDGVPYLTMAYIEGKTLAASIVRGRGWPIRRAVEVTRELAVALAEAHRRGIVHRDLKPANVMVDDRGALVLMDFGLARWYDDVDSSFTPTGAILGTPAYMPPEQAEGDLKAIGPRSDLYSLGVIFYELLTGRRPFEGPITKVLGMIAFAEPPRPSTHRREIDPALEAVCLKAMAKKPDQRHASMVELASVLQGWLDAPLDIPRSEPGFVVPSRRAVRVTSPDLRATADFARRLQAWATLAREVAEARASGFRSKVSGLGRRLKAKSDGAARAWRSRLDALRGLGNAWRARRAQASPRASADRSKGLGAEPPRPSMESTRSVIFRRTYLDRFRRRDRIMLGVLVAAWAAWGVTCWVRRDKFLAGASPSPVVFANRMTRPAPPLARPSSAKEGLALETKAEQKPPEVASPPPTIKPSRPSNEAGHGPASLVSMVKPASTIPGQDGMILRLIPEGTFEMGSDESDVDASGNEKPRHSVRIAQPFYLATTEVTQGQYVGVMKVNPSQFPDSPDSPVDWVSWLDAVMFCDKLSERQGLKPYYRGGVSAKSRGYGYRLPSEAEWEYACRANTPEPSSLLEKESWLGAQAWHLGNSASKAHPVRQKQPNAFGLHDMHGNVWEWCHDSFEGYDGHRAFAPSDGRVIRGGSWQYGSRSCRSATRSHRTVETREGSLGFRVARDLILP